MVHLACAPDGLMDRGCALWAVTEALAQPLQRRALVQKRHEVFMYWLWHSVVTKEFRRARRDADALMEPFQLATLEAMLSRVGADQLSSLADRFAEFEDMWSSIPWLDIESASDGRLLGSYIGELMPKHYGPFVLGREVRLWKQDHATPKPDPATDMNPDYMAMHVRGGQAFLERREAFAQAAKVMVARLSR